MSKGTNEEILGKGSKFTEVKKTAGRPRVNRSLVIRNLKLKDELGNRRYSNTQIASLVGCRARTVKRIWNDAIKNGEITAVDDTKVLGMIEADFDAECKRATGMSFKEWLQTRFKDTTTANTYFNFCSRVWDKIFEKCSIVELTERTSQVADQKALRFVSTFQEDEKRMRARLKKIRFLFRFIGRGDINDRHLTMTDSKHPRPKRRVPEISQTTFPLRYNEIEQGMIEELGEEVRLYMRVKIATQMRTGKDKDEREFYGIRKGTDTKTYLTMISPDEFQFHVFAKKSEHWDIIWLPKQVREELWEKYQEMEYGEQFAKNISATRFVKALKKVSKRIIGKELILHDFRKISLTWLYVMEVPLEVAVNLNVGWKDTNTALSNYLDVKKVLRKKVRADYRENIPDWFKEGLDDFTGFEAVIGEN